MGGPISGSVTHWLSCECKVAGQPLTQAQEREVPDDNLGELLNAPAVRADGTHGTKRAAISAVGSRRIGC